MLDTSLQDQMEHIFFNSSFDNFIYLFIFGCAGSSLLCGLFSNCSEEELLFVAFVGFSFWCSLIAEYML